MRAFNIVLGLAAVMLPSMHAVPVQSISERQSTDQPSTIDGTPFRLAVRYAQGAYCQPSLQRLLFSRGRVIYVAGDNARLPITFVAYDELTNKVVVSHQGTNPTSAESVYIDAQYLPTLPDRRLNGCVDPGSAMHTGFQKAWADTADPILAAVKEQLTAHPGATLLVTGHSLGAALATLDSAYLRCNLPDVPLQTTVLGLPRVGNSKFADSIDRLHNGTFHYLVNGQDPVPHIPFRQLSYEHPTGEVWINPANENEALSCPGRENSRCSNSVDPRTYNIGDHIGTYFERQLTGFPSPNLC
ncbi:alpha/beta-hydrolase [Ceraceosorus guamensis]|uniref:Alpha/beta-hydrolase n=1 Tax=Ceraceosorus guamensis TaxID=1522189 RepID=A0A316W623_9BASI|nr:alpha/beta-hydrolase [Ceraceosorus guamensis]PWN43483.1 alpha/beta-hydrolase [Ceraceosorus guamensis]